MLNEANQYIKDNEVKVNSTYRQEYHLMPPIGWMNDPNGVIWIENQLHVFYQFHPYSSKWGPMYWGHAISKNGIEWQNLPIAIAPDKNYDSKGCFSGTALYENNQILLMYTGGLIDNVTGKVKQVQCLAVSTDFENFLKSVDNPIIDDRNVSKQLNIFEFRDPKIIQRDDGYYAMIATKTQMNTGAIILYFSPDNNNWSYKSILLEGSDEFGIMWECPDYFSLEGKDILVISPINMPPQAEKYRNHASSIYFVGEIDWQSGRMIVETYDEIDGGLDFYAPQTTATPFGQVMIAWMSMWDRTNITNDLEHGWSGTMTLPRILTLKNNRLIQKPISSIYDLYSPLVITCYDKKSQSINIIDTKIIRLEIKNKKNFSLEISNKSQEKVIINYNQSDDKVTFSRETMQYEIEGSEDHQVNERECILNSDNSDMIELEIFIDKSSIELFINEGEYVLSSLVFPVDPWEKIAIKF